MTDPQYANAYEREFSYQKGKIDYFDPDFQGQVRVVPSTYELNFKMELHGYKNKLYLRVLMVMFKKLIRFIMLFDMIVKSMHQHCGKYLSYDVTFYFYYSTYQILGIQIPKYNKYELESNITLEIYYIQQGEN